VIELKNRMTEYERGYNLTDAVAEIRKYKTQLKKSEIDEQKLIEVINKRERELQKWVAENKILRTQAGVSENWGLNENDLELQQHIDIQQLQALNRHQASIITKLEEGRIELLDDLRKGTIDMTQNGLVFLGLTEDKTRLVTEYAERLRNDDPTLPIHDQTYELQRTINKLRTDLDKWKDNYATQQIEKDELQDKFIHLMERDKTLQYEQIMKSITDLKVNYSMNNAQNNFQLPTITENGTNNVQQQQLLKQIQAQQAQLARSLFTSATTGTVTYGPVSTDVKLILDKYSTLRPNEKQDLLQHLVPDRKQHIIDNDIISPYDDELLYREENKYTLIVDEISRKTMDIGVKGRLLGCINELLITEKHLTQSNDCLELYKLRYEKLSSKQQMLYNEFNQTKQNWFNEKNVLSKQLSDIQEEKDRSDLELARFKDISKMKGIQEHTPEQEVNYITYICFYICILLMSHIFFVCRIPLKVYVVVSWY
jgi:hypothetical protein